LYPKAPVIITSLTDQQRAGYKTRKATRDANISTAGKWRSFPKVPNLLQHVNTGIYFGRVKTEGKIFRASLGITHLTNKLEFIRRFRRFPQIFFLLE
jgi:hypothetical protein